MICIEERVISKMMFLSLVMMVHVVNDCYSQVW